MTVPNTSDSTTPGPTGQNILRAGHYARKQLFSRARLISWSHGSRFQMARRLVEGRGDRLLDYGCGDGTFLAMVSDMFPQAVGADIDEQQTEDCRRRLGSLKNLSFVLTQELKDPRDDGTFSVVVCMETLEHCVEETLEEVIDDLHRLVAADGTVIISVPIEIGPALVVKQVLRRLAGWRGLGDYRFNERYGVGELLRMTFATRATAIERPRYVAVAGDESSAYHPHKGFNWRSLRHKLARRFEVRETRFSPLGWSRGLLSSQAWFVCRPRPAEQNQQRADDVRRVSHKTTPSDAPAGSDHPRGGR